MAATYPGSVRVFSSKTNVIDTIDASHPNTIQEEVVAIETVLGENPNLSVVANANTAFNPASVSYGTVSARLANIENGVVADSHTQYLRKTTDGASTNRIDTNGINNRGLIIRGALNQAVNLQEWQDSIGVIQAALQPDGTFTGKTLANQIQGAVSAVPADSTVEQKNQDFTLAAGDKNKVFYLVNTSAPVVITVPTDSITFPVGSRIDFIRGAAGAVSFVGISPASVNATPGLILRAQWSAASLLKIANNTWFLSGDLSA
jgi:hypothetical protein